MKYKAFLLIISFLASISYVNGSNRNEHLLDYDCEKIIAYDENDKEDPRPKDGMDGLYRFFEKKRKYPKDAKKNGVEGKVYVEFIVDEEGNIPIEYIKIKKGVHPSLDQEAFRLISTMPKWKPGKDKKGNPIRVRMIIPIIFKL